MTKPLLEIQDIFNYLPQRPPFLLVDRVIHIEPGKTLTAIKNVTINEPFFEGHFPGQPIMPGVLILEALAQAATVFAFYSTDEDPKNSLLFFAGIDKARFKRPVVPGDQLILEVSLIKAAHGLWKVQVTAKVGDEVACTAELLSMIKRGKI